MKDNRKDTFIENLKKSGGIICAACESTGINRSTYYRWMETDGGFAESVGEVMDAQLDFVESRLMNLIRNNDTTATIFYLKTKGRKRGWNEKQVPEDTCHNRIESGVEKNIREPESGKNSLDARVKNKKKYIVSLLKKQGKYTSELSMQVTITAQLLVKTEMLAGEVLSEAHDPVDVEISREGNERKTISPKEKLYLDFVQQSQKALRALGMNTDSRERKPDNDALNGFLKEISE